MYDAVNVKVAGAGHALIVTGTRGNSAGIVEKMRELINAMELHSSKQPLSRIQCFEIRR
jgi:hypothetical protein